MPATDRPFNVLLSPDHTAMLSQLAATCQCSRGHVLRDALRWRFAMHCNHQPTCATGQPCLVPALHQVGPVAPVPMPQPPDSPSSSNSPHP